MHLLSMPLPLRGMTIQNRFIRSATHEGLADDAGHATDELAAYVRKCALGGVGLIISGHAYVSQEGKASPRQLSVCDDACIPGLEMLASRVHHAGSKFMLQLAHAGAFAREKISGKEPLGPMDVYEKEERVVRAMTAVDIARVVISFQEAAVRAQKAGCDGVQIHAAHGYLLSQFLSPFYNARTDQYGGTLENRSRFLCAVVRAVRAAVGDAFCLSVKINSEDFLEQGLSLSDTLVVCKMLEKIGVDAIELSGGTIESGEKTPIRKGDLREEKDEVFYRYAAEAYKRVCHVPLFLVGGIRSWSVAFQLVSQGIDAIALSRPLIREPELIMRWKNGDRRRATCISCNQCFRPLMTGKGLYCVVEKKERVEQSLSR